ncbi:MAG: transcriptional activator NhaR [Pirellulales bacterium]|nr:transcriptional activator NhaR [Pirellulales bacterium]
MDWLNYHHLLYFWMVAKEGSISKAAQRLHLAQPTLSSQIQKLEQSMGIPLFDRVGRSLALNEAGRLAYRYADEIFTLGRELTEAIQGAPGHSALKLTVGVPDVLPKLVVYRLLKPVISLQERVQLVCYEGKLQDLLSELASHHLDIVLADSPVTPSTHIRAFNHLLGESSVTVFGEPQLAQKYRRKFPSSLSGAPMLLPTQNTSLRRALEHWFDNEGLRPSVVHEFEDSAVLKVFGQHGEGLFAAPTVIKAEIAKQYRVKPIGEIATVTERFYAISVERRLKHPAVVQISQVAKEELFGGA